MGWKPVITLMESGLLLPALHKNEAATASVRRGALLLISLLLPALILLNGCAGNAGPVEQRLVLGEYFYDPTQIQGKIDQGMRITLVNEGSQAHTFTIEDLAVSDFHISDPDPGPDTAGTGTRLVDPAAEGGNGPEAARGDSIDGQAPDPDEGHEEPPQQGLTVTILPSSTVVVEFIPREAGTFTFFCDRPGHRDAGMEGTLLVTQR